MALGNGKLAYLEEREYRRISPASLGLNQGSRIAVIYAVGLISTGESSYDSPQGSVVGSDTLIDHIRQAPKDSPASTLRSMRSADMVAT